MWAIQRCPRHKAHEGVAGTIEYNANDRFCMYGVSSKLQGGEFRDGFRAAAFTQAFTPVIDMVPGSDFGAKATRVTIAAIVGGTASELGGGKFENGAMTGAFSRAFNDESHNDAKSEYVDPELGNNERIGGLLAGAVDGHLTLEEATAWWRYVVVY